MNVALHDPSDLVWLAERIETEKDARQRDRYRVVELALSQIETLEIAARVKRWTTPAGTAPKRWRSRPIYCCCFCHRILRSFNPPNVYGQGCAAFI